MRSAWLFVCEMRKVEFEEEREGDEDVINPKRERIALCAKEANVRSYTVHPRGKAPRQGAGCPRE